MHPATITVLLYPSAISLPVSAETRVSSVVYFSAPCSLSADLLATNEFERKNLGAWVCFFIGQSNFIAGGSELDQRVSMA